jgi:hypothetical protein
MADEAPLTATPQVLPRPYSTGSDSTKYLRDPPGETAEKKSTIRARRTALRPRIRIKSTATCWLSSELKFFDTCALASPIDDDRRGQQRDPWHFREISQSSPRLHPGSCARRVPKRAKVIHVRSTNLI